MRQLPDPDLPVEERLRGYVDRHETRRFPTMSKAIPVAMKEVLGEKGIWISGTTFHIKPGVELPEGLAGRALRERFADLEGD